MTTINNALDNATQTSRWRYDAMVNIAHRDTTKVGMQWVAYEEENHNFKMNALCRGEENQKQGGGIKSNSIIYTPEHMFYL